MLTTDSEPTMGILYIDDEEKALKYFRMAFAKKFRIFTAPTGEEGLEILRRESSSIAIVLSDQRMPGMSGAEVLGAVREEFPSIVRVLTTAYSDLDSAIQAVNKGHIYQYVVKPWEIVDLGMVLQRAADYHQVLTERNALLSMKMTTLQRILCSDRLKWLLLSGRDRDEADQAQLRRVLGRLITALPDSSAVLSPEPGATRMQNFEINTLLHREYHNASNCLRTIDQAWIDSPHPEIAVKTLVSALVEQTGISADQTQISNSGVDFQITLQAESSRSCQVLSALFGLLFEPEASPSSLTLFTTLLSLARHDGSLVISGETSDPDAPLWRLEFPFTPDQPPEADDIIDALAQRFSQWNISNR